MRFEPRSLYALTSTRATAPGHGRARLRDRSAQPIRPIFDCGSVGLGGLLVRTQNWLTDVSRVKLEPRLPGSVNSLLAANPHDVGSVTIEDLGGVFADKHGGHVRTGLDVTWVTCV